MEKVTAMQLVAIHLFVQSHQKATKEKLATKRHKKHKILEENLLCFLCLFVASFLLRGEFSFLFFVEALPIFFEPGFEIV